MIKRIFLILIICMLCLQLIDIGKCAAGMPPENYYLSPSLKIDSFENTIFKKAFSFWAGGYDNKQKITRILKLMGFKKGLKFPDNSYYLHARLKSTINEAILGNIRTHAPKAEYLYYTRETSLGMEVLVLDFGKGVRKQGKPVRNIDRIFDHGYSYEFDSNVYGWGMGHIASSAEILKVGSMNDGKISVVERGQKIVKDEMFTDYSVSQSKYNLSDLNVNAKASGFFYHFFLKKNPWIPGNMEFSLNSSGDIFGVMREISSRFPESKPIVPLFTVKVDDEVTLNYRKTDWTHYEGIYYGTLWNRINLDNPKKPFSIKITYDDSYNKNVPKIKKGDILEISWNELELISRENKRPYDKIKTFSDYKKVMSKLNLSAGETIRVVVKKTAQTFSHRGIVREIPNSQNKFVFKFKNIEITPLYVNEVIFHKSSNLYINPFEEAI
ncbi:MAG: hypothetical protein ABIG64_09680 [Candidatus Omnitrophota bacterium]